MPTPPCSRTPAPSRPTELFISAKTGAGIDTLIGRCAGLISGEFGATDLLVPHDRYDVIARLHEFGHIHAQEHRDDGVFNQGRFPPAQSAYFAPFRSRLNGAHSRQTAHENIQHRTSNIQRPSRISFFVRSIRAQRHRSSTGSWAHG